MKIFYDKEAKQLVYIDRAATTDFWDSQWSVETKNSLSNLYKKDTYVSTITKKYLPSNSVIVEGGCGRGNHVHALKQNRYKVIGIDSAPKTIRLLQKYASDLDIRLDDVRKTKLDSGTVDGYWSLGVIEHFYDGFDDIADDIARILRVEGYFFVTFPAMNILRRVKAKFNIYPAYTQENKKSFYQYALNPNKVIHSFSERNFELVKFTRNNGFKGLKDEAPVCLQKYLQTIYNSNNLICKIIQLIIDKLLSFCCGHSALIIFQKK